MRKRILLLLMAVCLALSAAGCQKRQELSRYSSVFYDVFDTAAVIQGYAASQEEFLQTEERIHQTLSDYHRLFDIYHEYEGVVNLCTVNRHAAEGPVAIGEEVMAMLQFSKDVYALTDGSVNVAMGSVLTLWHEAREYGLTDPEKAALPDEAELRAAAEHININDVLLDKQAGTVFLADPLLQLDVGAVAKGWAVEKTAQLLEQQGISGYLLNIGGTVRGIGEKPDGSSWTAGVQDPFDANRESCFLAVPVSDAALVTSGTYQRYYIVDGVRYHHIIHPETLMPAEAFESVSILCRDAGIGDALSTALFNMTLEKGKALADGLESVEVCWILPDGSRVLTDGFENGSTKNSF